MNWVSIDKEKCNACGLCAIRCVRCFTHAGDTVTAHADQDNCNLCGHCIALCPPNAITHQKLKPDDSVAIDDRVRFDPKDFIKFVNRRRTHRHFKSKTIPRRDLETLVELCRYIPTGSNRQSVEIIVLQDRDRIKQLSDLTVDFFQDMIRKTEAQADQSRQEGQAIPQDLQDLLDTLGFRKRLVEARTSGLDPIFYGAPAVMLFHSEMQPSTPKDDCVIAAQTLTLMAPNMGLETCYIGLCEIASKHHPPLQQALNLPSGHQLLSVLILGYPKLKYLRTVDRNPIKVRWE